VSLIQCSSTPSNVPVSTMPFCAACDTYSLKLPFSPLSNGEGLILTNSLATDDQVGKRIELPRSTLTRGRKAGAMLNDDVLALALEEDVDTEVVCGERRRVSEALGRRRRRDEGRTLCALADLFESAAAVLAELCARERRLQCCSLSS